MKEQYIGYHLTGNDESVPVATADNREECQRKTITRVLASGMVDGQIAVQQRKDIEPGIFKELSELINNFFAERGIE